MREWGKRVRKEKRETDVLSLKMLLGNRALILYSYTAGLSCDTVVRSA